MKAAIIDCLEVGHYGPDLKEARAKEEAEWNSIGLLTFELRAVVGSVALVEWSVGSVA